MTATPMLDKVRQYAKDWGVTIVGDRSGMSGSARVIAAALVEAKR